jgi:RNA polymerase sigma-70 factor, ECF subfamily
MMGAPQPAEPYADRRDEELLLLIAAGQREALGPLYARYAGVVYGIAARSFDASTAEEIVQEVFLAAWRGAATFDPERGAVRGWLLQIARYRIINEIRRRSRRPQTAGDSALRLVELADPDPSPDEALFRDEQDTAVRAALAELPAAQRSALSLAFFGGMTHEQVADRLDLPLGTAKTRIRAGMHKMRVLLAPTVAVLAALILGTLAALGWRLHQQGQQQTSDEEALRLAVTSETSVLHLSRGAGDAAVPQEAHGSYRGREGEPLAVLSVSHFPPPPHGFSYQAWSQKSGVWTRLGEVHATADGSAILILHGEALKVLPDLVEVTLEPGTAGSTPAGVVVLRWTTADRPTP